MSVYLKAYLRAGLQFLIEQLIKNDKKLSSNAPGEMALRTINAENFIYVLKRFFVGKEPDKCHRRY